MKYRHVFHAGNFADVHKHLTWLALLKAMQRKPKGFLVLDTHAGAGCYDLNSPDAQRSAESAAGIDALLNHMKTAAGCPAESARAINEYLALLAKLRTTIQQPTVYPGSPLWSLAVARPQERIVCFETQATEHEHLDRVLERAHVVVSVEGAPRAKALCADGLAALPAWLPAPERRALILIDPPYEYSDEDVAASRRALRTILERLTNAVIALWYPIKHRADADRLLKALIPAPAAPGEAAPMLRSELWLHPCDSRVGLNGSGMLLINPPWQIDTELQAFMPTLHSALDPTSSGGWRLY